MKWVSQFLTWKKMSQARQIPVKNSSWPMLWQQQVDISQEIHNCMNPEFNHNELYVITIWIIKGLIFCAVNIIPYFRFKWE